MAKQNNGIIVCGADEIERYRSSGITHLIRIVNPGAADHPPVWFKGDYLCLQFGDVISEADARACRTRSPDRADINLALEFSRQAFARQEGRILVSCDYGASRSPALAYVLLADRMGSGSECAALQEVLRIRPDAVPNTLVVALGDGLLGRNGALLKTLNTLYDEITSLIGSTPMD